jgi:hypothetical protein
MCLDDACASPKAAAARASAAEHDRFEKEMQVAREIQESILPQSVPAVPGFEIARLYRPAQAVGGSDRERRGSTGGRRSRPAITLKY